MIRLTDLPPMVDTRIGTWVKITSLKSKFLVPAGYYRRGALIPARVTLYDRPEGPSGPVDAYLRLDDHRSSLLLPRGVAETPHMNSVRSLFYYAPGNTAGWAPSWIDPQRSVAASMYPSHAKITEAEHQRICDGEMVRVYSYTEFAQDIPDMIKLEVLLNSEHVAARRLR